jgi:hypothetical protein
MYSVGTTLNPTVSKKNIQDKLRADVRQRRKWELGAVSTKLGGGALEIFEREFFSNYLAGRIAAEDGFPDEMIFALFQEKVCGARQASGSRKTGFKVMAKKLFISQAPEEYFELKDFLTLRNCLESLEYVEAFMEGWEQVIDIIDDKIRQANHQHQAVDDSYESFLRWKELRRRPTAEITEVEALNNERNNAIRRHREFSEKRDLWRAEWCKTMDELEMPATRQAWEGEVKKWQALAGNRDVYECELRDALAKRIMDKLAS